MPILPLAGRGCNAGGEVPPDAAGQQLRFPQHRLKSCLGVCHHHRPPLGVETARTVRVDGEIRVQLARRILPVIVQEEIWGGRAP